MATVIFSRPLNDLDELWNYNFARNIYEGAVPYKEFNMVPTPLSAYTAAFFLRIFGNRLFAFRMLGVFLAFLLFVLFWKISEGMIGARTISFCAAVYMMLFHLSYVTYDYNYFNLLLILAVIALERRTTGINEAEADSRRGLLLNILIGLILGFTPLVKQSTGAFVLLANLIVCCVDFRIYKKTKKAVGIRIFASLVPGVIFLLVLILNHSLEDFWDYAVCGIAAFDNKISYVDFLVSSPISFVLGCLPFLIAVYSVFRIRREICLERQRFQLVLLVLSLAEFSVVFPIADYIHFFIALTPFLILLFAHMKPIRISRRQGMFCCIFAALTTGFAVYLMLPLQGMKCSSLKHYENIPIDEAAEQKIIRVDCYIQKLEQQGREVFIADASAAVYMIPLDLYHKDFDLLLKGNTGSQSIEQLLSGKENAVFLVVRDSRSWNWQTNRELLYYIMENYKYVGEVEQFDVYSTEK